MSSIIDLDKDTCSPDVIEALNNYFRNVIYKINKNSAYFEEIINKYKIEIIRDEGDVIYFRVISSSG
jgi:hypothetical protein